MCDKIKWEISSYSSIVTFLPQMVCVTTMVVVATCLFDSALKLMLPLPMPLAHSSEPQTYHHCQYDTLHLPLDIYLFWIKFGL